MLDENAANKKVRVLRKITKQRLKNIALYYLKRFDSSVENLRSVLKRRVSDYAYHNSEFNKAEALEWIEEVLCEFEGYGYLNDERYAEIKVRGYLSSGKSARYIKNKMREKGIEEELVSRLLGENEYDAYELAMWLAKKKKIGPFRAGDDRQEFRQKDMMKLVSAGFDYDVVQKVMGSDLSEENF